MKLYQLQPKLRAECVYVTVKASEERMFDYFVRLDGDGKFLQYMKLLGEADTGLKDSDLEKVDFLQGFVSLPKFFRKNSWNCYRQKSAMKSLSTPLKLKQKRPAKAFLWRKSTAIWTSLTTKNPMPK